MENKRRKSYKSCKKSKTEKLKSLIVDFRFLLIVFACLFIVLGGLALHASAGPNPNIIHENNSNGAAVQQDKETDSDSNAAADYPDVLMFKCGDTLQLSLNSAGATDILIISDESAITEVSIVDEVSVPDAKTCVTVSLDPFTITPVNEGSAVVNVTAKMKDGTLQTASLKVAVKDETETPSAEVNPEPVYTLQGNISCQTESYVNIEFSIIDSLGAPSGIDVFLKYQTIKGNVQVSIVGNAAYVRFISEDTTCKIKFTAAAGAQDIEFLFVFPRSSDI